MLTTSWIQPGKNIFEEDWDLLVILDACRIDALREFESEYDFINSIDSRWSVGSTSKEFINRTYTQEYQNEIKKPR